MCDLKSLRRNVIMQVLFSCCCECPSSGSLIFGVQIVHINEGKGKLALFLHCKQCFTYPSPFHNFVIFLPQFFIPIFPSSSSSSSFLLFSLLLLLLIFYCFPSSSSSSSFLLFSLLLLLLIFYCFPSFSSSFLERTRTFTAAGK